MFLLCLKIFFARILDVSIGTYRTLIMVKGQRVKASILAFFEVFIWFFVAREALQTDVNSLLIPISYSLGYASGSFIGSWLVKRFVEEIICVQVITTKDCKGLKEKIKANNFGVSEIMLKKTKDDQNSHMLFIELDSKKLNLLKELIERYDKKAFIIVSETKYVANGWIK